MNPNQKLEEISRKIDGLATQYTHFQNQVNDLKTELTLLKNSLDPSIIEEQPLILETQTTEKEIIVEKIITLPLPLSKPSPATKLHKIPTDIEKFIGENLSNKIGIVITVLGVSIGVKYAIDHNLISPLTRIILGYVMGFGLFGISVKLRSKYNDLSAVILGGALATMYFVTYTAYDLYHLIPQIIAFMMMVIVTIFTVVTALNYDRQIIAIGGLIGAYAVPFLLSNDEGRPAVLFSYVLLINCGILYIAFKKDWKPTNYLAFGLTWLVFMVWFFDYEQERHFALALTFLTLFFVLFYITFLAYKFIRNQAFSPLSVFFLLLNSTIFYGYGYVILQDHETGKHLLGLFTLANALIHFGVSVAVYRRNLSDKNLFFTVSGLVLAFLTLAIPVQLNGHWVTIFWACEMALLFWIGRTKGVLAYEKLSYSTMALTLVSLAEDLTKGYNGYSNFTPAPRLLPIANVYFLTTVIVIAAYWFVRKIHNDSTLINDSAKENYQNNYFGTALTALLMLLVYSLFYNEIGTYFDQNYIDSAVLSKDITTYNDSILLFKSVWLINYTLFFVSVLNFINLKKYQSEFYAVVGSVLACLSLFVFLTGGLFQLSEIKNAYLNNSSQVSASSLAVRYPSYTLVVGILYVLNQNRKQFFSHSKPINIGLELIVHTVVLWCVSAEMIHWLEMYDFDGTYKLALSILFGVYALFLIVLGINQAKKYLRLAAIGLFGCTLAKLFLYDLANLSTISKTIVLVSLGVLLLIISFLYNKFKQTQTSDEN